MSNIIHGRVTVGSAGKAVQLTKDSTLVKYLLLQVPAVNSGSIYFGNATVAHDNAPAIAKGTSKEFTFKYDAEETPCDLSDFYVDANASGDMVNYLAITT